MNRFRIARTTRIPVRLIKRNSREGSRAGVQSDDSDQWQRPAASHVRIAVYDILGGEVAVLMDEKKEAGRYEVTWDAGGFARGVYTCRMTAGIFVDCKKMALTK
ncbi:MAG TPA: hypothetical protein VMG09_18290 [Bacteroidota bacterium]|nr:hypothetical protein [Bacteroidota bacterium]